MIRFAQGNLLESGAEALVNTVNEVGVMGKGIALMFRDAFPTNTAEYERAAKAKKIRVGRMFVTENPVLPGPRWIINFPTKKHWRGASRIEWIREGLENLVGVVSKLGIRSIALPPLGCGNGGLDWNEVRPLIEQFAGRVPDVEIMAYTPTDAYQGIPKQRGVERLTLARALVTELVRRYAVLGLECTILEVQKLAWFLSREIAREGLPDPLRLEFRANKFGPYDDRLRHLLDALDGSFLHSEKRLSDAGPFDLIRFEDARASEVSDFLAGEEAQPYHRALEATAALIDGFESPFGMELLATVDWLLARERIAPRVEEVDAAMAHWPGGASSAARKRRLFDRSRLAIALERLTETLDRPRPAAVGGLFG